MKLFVFDTSAFGAGQVRKLVKDDPGRLLSHKSLLCALKLWGASATLGNMGTERMFAAIRKSAPLRCSVDRLICAGFLSLLHTVHLKCGGKDIRRLTRTDAVKSGAPLRAAKTKFARKKQSRAFRFQFAFRGKEI